jgi:response regulator RpfG family c-di-GMP phosphodiesterase
MDIAERLAASDPSNTGWQRDLVMSLVRLAEAAPHLAREHVIRALAIVTSLAETDRLAPSDAWMIEDLTGRLHRLGD